MNTEALLFSVVLQLVLILVAAWACGLASPRSASGSRR